MIDSFIFDKLDPDMKNAVGIALGIVGQSGIIKEQIQVGKEQLLAGASDQDPLVLAEEIRKHRVWAQTLESLQDLCETFN